MTWTERIEKKAKGERDATKPDVADRHVTISLVGYGAPTLAA